MPIDQKPFIDITPINIKPPPINIKPPPVKVDPSTPIVSKPVDTSKTISPKTDKASSNNSEATTPGVDRKTEVTSNKTTTEDTSTFYSNKLNYSTVTGSNILNSYRSYTYNFTLAALSIDEVNDPSTYRNKKLKRVILKSGGKGAGGIASAAGPTTEQIKANNNLKNAYEASQEEINASQKNIDTLRLNSGIASAFNSDSPGRFDMYIDEVEIHSLLTTGEKTGYSQATNVSFTVVEPYSINGFLEALHVSAVSAGYPGWQTAKFVLVLDFWGYPDNKNQDFPAPEKIPGSSRYFPIIFSTVDIEVTEKGTVYKCSLTPPSDRAMANPNQLKSTINMKGKTVYEILKNFMDQLNKQTAQSDQDSRETEVIKHDIYKISFPDWDPKTGLNFNKDQKNQEIAKSKMGESLKDSGNYSFLPPGSTTKKNAYHSKDSDATPTPTPEDQIKQPEKNKPNPYNSDFQVQATEGSNIHEIISSVIRDSEYIKNKFKDLPRSIGSDGMIDYFMIRINVKDFKEIDKVSKKPYQEFEYVVYPYKVHYSCIPGYASLPINYNQLNLQVGRSYNYIYTGKNVDILNFKLEFNNLFFEAVGKGFGNTDAESKIDNATSNGEGKVKIKDGNPEQTSASQTPVAGIKVTHAQTSVTAGRGTPNAGATKDDPYYIMARTFHEAIIHSSTALTSGEIEIVGDPYYVTTGGLGNYDPTVDLSKTNTTSDGEARVNRGELQIAITFNNPIDYGSFEDGGTMYFDTKKVPFGGIYRVNEANSTFKDGVFKQVLTIMRRPGQFIDIKIPSASFSSALATTPNPNNQQNPTGPLSPESIAQSNGTLAAFANGTGADTFNLKSMLGRGLPNNDSNFTNALGGLGGTTNFESTQVSGAIVSGIGMQTANGSALFGGAIPGGVDQLASGIRMEASGLIGLGHAGLGTAANVINMGNLLNNNYLTGQSALISGNLANSAFRDLGMPPLTSALASKVVSQQAGKIVARSGILGSGIGINSQKALKGIIAASTALQKADQILSINPELYLSGLASQKINQALNMVPQDYAKTIGLVSAIANQSVDATLATGLSGLASHAPASYYTSVLGGNPISPSLLSNQLGINASQLSGLSDPFSSFISKQISGILDAIPQDVDLKAFSAQGVLLDTLTADTLPNLPTNAPYTSAPADATEFSNRGATYNVNNFTLPGTNTVLFDNGVNALGQQNANMNITLGALQSQIFGADGVIQGNRLVTYTSGLPGLTGYAGSLESSQASINAATGGFIGNPSSAVLSSSVVTQYGSTAAMSPLQKLISG